LLDGVEAVVAQDLLLLPARQIEKSRDLNTDFPVVAGTQDDSQSLLKTDLELLYDVHAVPKALELDIFPNHLKEHPLSQLAP
jgi:hypothetical protein